ncbi:MAG: 4a-hydroxytetrahydrobiopterin dehydratase [Labilithrix sp.]|nr:4a-hydroxytetrahydrobiopterin dehydratase [Labilithrix sp.]MCW5834776.1 4a-hydroxytetrahydrobiopterin dehydratase [Labilithrix sp.]
MARPPKLDAPAVAAWLAEHPGWTLEGDALVRTFETPDFAAALAFAVRLGLLAEKRDHHPDVLIGWGKARVVWTTHDAGGVSQLDLDLAAATDALAGVS